MLAILIAFRDIGWEMTLCACVIRWEANEEKLLMWEHQAFVLWDK